jgi:hypothetical protein
LISIALLFFTPPLYGQYALEFDGVNDYAEVPHDSTLEFTTEITVEMWFLVDAIPQTGTQQIFQKKAGGVYNTFLFLFRDGDLFAGFAYVGQAPLTVPGDSIDVGVWNHAAITYDGATYRLFLNGDEMDSLPGDEKIRNEPTPVTFGRYDVGFGQYFDGAIDEARIWNISRTVDEIQSTMNVELSGFEEGLVGYWKFNEGISSCSS